MGKVRAWPCGFRPRARQCQRFHAHRNFNPSTCQVAQGDDVASSAIGRWPMLSPKAVSGDYACPA
eukprot:3384249-Prymnesium_polylepis.1